MSKKKQSDTTSGKRGRLGFRDGYLSFDAEELLRLAEAGGPNAEAYRCLYESINTSSDIREKKYRKGDVDIDDVYPITAEETEQMREYLRRALDAVQDRNDEFFYKCYAELESIADWSSTRHRNFQWALIAGVLLTIGFLTYKVSDARQNVADSRNEHARIKNWAEDDTAKAVWGENGDTVYLNHADVYRYKKMEDAERYRQMYERNMAYYTAVADTAADRSERREAEKKYKENEENEKLAAEEFNELKTMEFKELQKLALKDAKETIKSDKKKLRRVRSWNLFFLLLIPLYIYAERPYGYNISRYRAEARTLGGIRKFFYGLAAVMAGSALAMEYLPDTIVKWSDGSTTRESDPTNFVIFAMKIGLYIAAVAVICITACILMLYLTVQGLRRNYDWGPVLAKIRGKIGEAQQ